MMEGCCRAGFWAGGWGIRVGRGVGWWRDRKVGRWRDRKVGRWIVGREKLLFNNTEAIGVMAGRGCGT
jgi:hypothetical protein